MRGRLPSGVSAETNGASRVGSKLPVFKVVKTFVPLQEHPRQIQGVLGYEFFEYDAERGRAREFSPEVVPQRDLRYWERLDDLAYDIKQLIEELKHANGDASDTREKVLARLGPALEAGRRRR